MPPVHSPPYREPSAQSSSPKLTQFLKKSFRLSFSRCGRTSEESLSSLPLFFFLFSPWPGTVFSSLPQVSFQEDEYNCTYWRSWDCTKKRHNRDSIVLYSKKRDYTCTILPRCLLTLATRTHSLHGAYQQLACSNRTPLLHKSKAGAIKNMLLFVKIQAQSPHDEDNLSLRLRCNGWTSITPAAHMAKARAVERLPVLFANAVKVYLWFSPSQYSSETFDRDPPIVLTHSIFPFLCRAAENNKILGFVITGILALLIH